MALLVLAVGSFFVARSGFKNRERIAIRQFEEARSSSLIATVLGFTVAGVIPGFLNLLLYTRIGRIMVNRRPEDPLISYLLPLPSEGLFLGRYFGWLAGYLLVLYFGYTQLPRGLAGISDWLSPVFGVHFNTLIVASYLVFANPLTYPPLLQLWATVGLLGGLIAGGRVGRGFLVGLTVFLSTMGALGLASLAIFRTFSFSTLANIPPPPPGFSLGSVATGPVARDLIPLFFQGASPTDPAFIQTIVLTLLRNLLLVVAVVTLSGRAGCLLWQGAMFLAKKILGVTKRPKVETRTEQVAISPASTTKATLLLFFLVLGLFALPPQRSLTPDIFHAPPAGPYLQALATGLNMLGAPNSSLRLTNLDLSSRGLVLDNNYAGNNMTAFIINNNYPEAFGSGPQSFILRLFSQPALVTLTTGSLGPAMARADAVAAQFSQALGMQLSFALALPAGTETIVIYAPTSPLSNSEALGKLLAVLPAASFSSLVNPASLESQRYLAMLGLLPSFNLPGFNMAAGGFSFTLDVQWPRMFYREGPHLFSLKTLLGFQTGITADPGANASLLSLTFQKGTVLYSPLGPNPFYDNFTSTYYLNATMGAAADFAANFTYPFAPNVVVRKTIDPPVGSVGSTRGITVTVQNLDSVTVENLNVTDQQVSPSYQATVQLAPTGSQTLRLATFIPQETRTIAYLATPKSSGAYVMTPATVDFAWLASNGTRINYEVSTGEVVLSSLSGPQTQFTNTMNDLWPYSILLGFFLIMAPIIEVVRRLGRKKRNISAGS